MENRLLTDDSYIDGLRKAAIPLWEIKMIHQQEELRRVCKAQRALTLKAVVEVL